MRACVHILLHKSARKTPHHYYILAHRVFSLKRTLSDARGLDAFFFSSSQMKELGVIFYNCSCLVLDLQRIFALYSSLKFKSRVPQTWSKRLYGVYDSEKKLQLQLNETRSQAFVSVGGCLRLLLHPPPARPSIKLGCSRVALC